MPFTTDAILEELREVERDCDKLKKRIDNLIVMALSKRDRDQYLAESLTSKDVETKAGTIASR